MSSEVAVRLEDVSKRYWLGQQRDGNVGIRHVIANLAARPFRRGPKPQSGEFWALRGVTFDLKQGEVLGIIGRNGSGKSTLLKILSRITEPTTGRVGVKGRVASLLEVGTGFHPELTGRENIFLNGAILGMTRKEITQKFDAIVDFAGVEKFLDTPVKRFSSGMYVRLAFSVAAHLEPEILVIDEVLAVGDLEFQQKCIGRMQEVESSGRTVLFVSHNLPLVERLCSKAILLREGQMVATGNPTEVVSSYLEEGKSRRVEWINPAPTTDRPEFRHIRLCAPDGTPTQDVPSDGQTAFDVEYFVPPGSPKLTVSLSFRSRGGPWLFSTSPEDQGRQTASESGIHRAVVRLPSAMFMPKTFAMTAALYSAYESFHWIEDALAFDVVERVSIANVLVGGRVGELQIVCDWVSHATAGTAI